MFTEFYKDKNQINAKDGSGYTPLALAVRARDFEATKTLLKNGAEINSFKDADGKNIMHIAADKFHDKIFLELIKNGAEIIEDNNGFLPHYYNSNMHSSHNLYEALPSKLLSGIIEFDKLFTYNTSHENSNHAYQLGRCFKELFNDNEIKSALFSRASLILEVNPEAREYLKHNLSQIQNEYELERALPNKLDLSFLDILLNNSDLTNSASDVELEYNDLGNSLADNVNVLGSEDLDNPTDNIL